MKHLELFYVRQSDVDGDRIILRDSEFKHLTRVLRKQKGDSAWATDGLGNQYEFVISALKKDSIEGRIMKCTRMKGEPLIELTLASAILKGNRFDWIIEKGTELGVKSFIPLITYRGIAKESRTKRLHWQKIAIAAMKQCGRSFLPEITQAMDVHEALQLSEKMDLKLIAHTDGRGRSLKSVVAESLSQGQKSAIILIGPEGGFTQEEVALALQKGFCLLSLGERRLRSETAAIVVATLLLWEFKDL